MYSPKLSPIRKNDVEVGSPLPWPVYDRDRKLLLCAGYVLESSTQVDRLIEAGMYRMQLPEAIASGGADKGNLEGEGSSGSREAEPLRKIAFREARLPVGTGIQLQLADNPAAERHQVKLIGYLDKQSLIVTHPTHLGQLSFVKDGTSYRCHAFAGKTAYIFESSVIRAVMTPYPYMHLVYPNALRTNLVRKSARVATEVVATAKSAGNNRSITCTIRDLSLTGAMIQSAQMSVEVGTILEVAFRLANEKKPTLIELEARVRNVQQSGMGDRQVQKIGLEFMPLSESVERALELYIYRQLVQEI